MTKADGVFRTDHLGVVAYLRLRGQATARPAERLGPGRGRVFFYFQDPDGTCAQLAEDFQWGEASVPAKAYWERLVAANNDLHAARGG